MRSAFVLRATACLGAVCVMATSSPAQRTTLDARAARTWASLLAVADQRVADTSTVDSALASPIVQLRAAAVRVVGLNRIEARFATARTLVVSSRDTVVARDAAFALGLAMDTASCGALHNALGDSRAGVAAAWAIGEMGDRCGSFASHFQKARGTTVRAALLRVAGKWSQFPDSLVVAAYRAAASVDERWAAVYTLARNRRLSGASLAVQASRDSVAAIREVATRLLTVALQPGPDSLAAFARLGDLLRDVHPHVRVAAVRSIASYRADAAPLLEKAWTAERDANVRVTMAQSFGTVATATSAVWGIWWRSDTTHMVRRSLITSAWLAGAIDVLQQSIVDSLATHPDYRMRIAMIDGAATQRSERNAAAIAARRADADPRVRAAVLSALSGPNAPLRDSQMWNAMLGAARQDDDVGVRQAALETASRTAGAADAHIALAGYLRAMRDSASDAREAALQLLATAWQRDSLAFADSTLNSLRQLAPSPDPLLRQRVRLLTPLAHWRSLAVPPVPSLASYERIVRDVIAPTLRGHPPVLSIQTVRGPVRIVLDGVQSPMTADHLTRLARDGYFRDLRFHRVVPAFVAQGGDPRGDGSGGPGFAIRDELNRSAYLRGAVGMALSGPDTGGSQFFLTLAAQPHLDGHYTVFGRVVTGLAAMDALVQGDALRNISPVPE